MYIRIQDNSIKFRVSKQEAEQLIEGDELSSMLSLPNEKHLLYKITTSKDENDFQYLHHENIFSLLINRNELLQEIETRPSKNGIIFQTEINRSPTKFLTLSLEIDIKKKP